MRLALIAVLLAGAVAQAQARYERGDRVLLIDWPPLPAARAQIVAVPGDRVATSRNGIFVNGELTTDPWLNTFLPSFSHEQAVRIVEPNTYIVASEERRPVPDERGSRSMVLRHFGVRAASEITRRVN